MLHLKSAKLARWQLRLVCWSGAALWLSGVVWLLLHNFFQVQGEFGPETNSFEPWLLRLHGAAMIAAMLGVGSLLVVHVWRGWTYPSQRVIGLALIAFITVLVATGYLLYYVTNDTWRAGLALVHWLIGAAALPLFVLHFLQGKRIGRS
jgi:hypothetical protein